MTTFADEPLLPGKTLVFFDEIQECPRARTAIKFLVDDGRFDYIESGSLLGVSYKEVPSYPVGYEESIQMHPLDLEEFFWANGVQPEIIDSVKKSFGKKEPLIDALHDRLSKLFYYYLAVGGMPAAVQAFVETSDLAQVVSIQKNILAQYRQDITRYSSNKMHIHAIFDAIPSELDRKNKRFKLSNLSKSARMERYESDFMWLIDAGVALPCYNVVQPQMPLAINTQHNLFKLYFCDVGLLSAAISNGIQLDLIQGNVGINWGSILENALAQQLVSNGLSLRYYDKPKIGEIDFLIRYENAIVPLEAKSGKSFRQHASLDNIMAVKEWGLKDSYVFCSSNIERMESVTYVPWYAIMCLKEKGLGLNFVVDRDSL